MNPVQGSKSSAQGPGHVFIVAAPVVETELASLTPSPRPVRNRGPVRKTGAGHLLDPFGHTPPWRSLS